MNVKNKLLDALANAGDEYISGAALAAQLGVSRNAVWKAVKALSAEGYGIDLLPRAVIGSRATIIVSRRSLSRRFCVQTRSDAS